MTALKSFALDYPAQSVGEVPTGHCKKETVPSWYICAFVLLKAKEVLHSVIFLSNVNFFATLKRNITLKNTYMEIDFYYGMFQQKDCHFVKQKFQPSLLKSDNGNRFGHISLDCGIHSHHIGAPCVLQHGDALPSNHRVYLLNVVI